MAISSFYPPMQPYASDALKSRGRLIVESASPTRTEFHRDRDRILHSTAFRRLKGKTQVFVAPSSDHIRTRLTHTLEVSQIARSLSRALGLDEDLSETIALAHDLGHPPFGHVGEDALNALMAHHGGFDHNAQALRIVTTLEHRYALFNGLNLTWEVLEGLVKHNGALLHNVPHTILDYCAINDLEIETNASLEAQAAAIADDIAYLSHDVDDGLRSGLLLISELEGAVLTRDIMRELHDKYGTLDAERFIYEMVRRIITHLVEDVLKQASLNLAQFKPQSAEEVRHAPSPFIVFSAAMEAKQRQLKSVLFNHFYRHDDILPMREQAIITINSLFEAFPDKSPREKCDYIAGMTDNFAIKSYNQLAG